MNNIFNIIEKMLDLIFLSNEMDVNVDKSSDPLVMEDSHHPALHISVFGNFISNNLNENINFFKFNFKKTNFVQLNSLLSLLDWSCLYNCSDINDVLILFYDKMFDCFLKSVPITSLNLDIKRSSWYDNEVRALKNRKNKLWVKFKQSNQESDFINYCYGRDIYNNSCNLKIY